MAAANLKVYIFVGVIALTNLLIYFGENLKKFRFLAGQLKPIERNKTPDSSDSGITDLSVERILEQKMEESYNASMKVMKYEHGLFKAFDTNPILHLELKEESFISDAVLMLSKKSNGHMSSGNDCRDVIDKFNHSITNSKTLRIVIDISFKNDDDKDEIKFIGINESTFDSSLSGQNLCNATYTQTPASKKNNSSIDDHFVSIINSQSFVKVQKQRSFISSTPRQSINRNQIPIFKRPPIRPESKDEPSPIVVEKSDRKISESDNSNKKMPSRVDRAATPRRSTRVIRSSKSSGENDVNVTK